MRALLTGLGILMAQALMALYFLGLPALLLAAAYALTEHWPSSGVALYAVALVMCLVILWNVRRLLARPLAEHDRLRSSPVRERARVVWHLITYLVLQVGPLVIGL